MKKKIKLWITILLPVYISIVGCTAKGTVSEKEINAAKSINTEESTDSKTSRETESDESSKTQFEQTESDTVQISNEDDLIYKYTVLTRQAQTHKVCIVVEPSVLRKYSFYYYTPDGRDQEWLQQYMDTMPAEEKIYEGKWKGLKETGWRIAYENKCFEVFEGGFLEYNYLDESGELKEIFIEAPKLCDNIQIMLQEKLDYMPFDPANIKNIVSAKLEVNSTSTNREFYSQTITDKEKLKLFEDWFSNAEYIYGGAECGNQDACLELILADGESIYLSVATDSCPNFGINGLYYDYRPETVWDNREFFKQFDEIPWDWDIDT